MQKYQNYEPQSHKTYRVTVDAIEEIIHQVIPVLDHGFIKVIDYMGGDSSITQAARVSYGKSTTIVQLDKDLISHLMKNEHTSPFEMCEIKMHIKMPIFVARQWLRHRTASINEYSARYSILDKEFYVPEYECVIERSVKNSRHKESEMLGQKEAERMLQILKADSAMCYEHYCEMLNIDENTGKSLNNHGNSAIREIARTNLPLNCYTQMYWKINLHNLLHFLKLRTNVHAQFEIREYADRILGIVKKWVPHVYDAFLNYQLNSYKLSGEGVKIVRDFMNGRKKKMEDYGVSAREWAEITNVFGITEEKMEE